MSASCKRIRERLTAQAPAASPVDGIRDHLAACAACRRYAARLDALRRGLADHHAGVEPDRGFPARVAAALPYHGDASLGHAALRLLPVTIALVLALAWFALQHAPPTTDDVETAALGDDPLVWLLETTEELP